MPPRCAHHLELPALLLTICAVIEIGRGDFEPPATPRWCARHASRGPRARDVRRLRRRAGSVATPLDGRRPGGARRPFAGELQRAAQLRVWFCAKGLRAQAELAALARARRDADAVRSWLGRAREHIAAARRAAEEASAVTPNAGGWLAQAEAEYERAIGAARPESWSDAATTWEQLERPPLAAYCRWREAEALVTAGASRTEASVPLRAAHSVATRLGAQPLLRELELLAERARLDLTSPEGSPRSGTTWRRSSD